MSTQRSAWPIFPAPYSYGPTSFRPDRHAEPFWVEDFTMLWVWFHDSNQSNLLHLVDAHVSRRQGMFKRMKLAPSPICDWELEDQTAEHILQRCPLLQTKETCGQRRSIYTPNSTAAGRNWRRQIHSTCRLYFQCSGDREKEEEEEGTSTIHIDFIYLLFTLNIIFGFHQCLVQLLCFSLWAKHGDPSSGFGLI